MKSRAFAWAEANRKPIAFAIASLILFALFGWRFWVRLACFAACTALVGYAMLLVYQSKNLPDTASIKRNRYIALLATVLAIFTWWLTPDSYSRAQTSNLGSPSIALSADAEKAMDTDRTQVTSRSVDVDQLRRHTKGEAKIIPPEPLETSPRSRLRVPDEPGEGFTLENLEQARKTLLEMLAAQSEYESMPFPIQCSIVRRIADDIYEVRNRVTSRPAILRTTKTRYESKGIAMLVVTGGRSITIEGNDGFDKTLSVFTEAGIDYDTGEKAYFDAREQVKEMRADFWKHLDASNLKPTQTADELTRILDVPRGSINAGMWKPVRSQWLARYNKRNAGKDGG